MLPVAQCGRGSRGAALGQPERGAGRRASDVSTAAGAWGEPVGSVPRVRRRRCPVMGLQEGRAADAEQEGLTPARVRHPRRGNLCGRSGLTRESREAGQRGREGRIPSLKAQDGPGLDAHRAGSLWPGFPVPVEALGPPPGHGSFSWQLGEAFQVSLLSPADLRVCVFAGVCEPRRGGPRGQVTCAGVSVSGQTAGGAASWGWPSPVGHAGPAEMPVPGSECVLCARALESCEEP